MERIVEDRAEVDLEACSSVEVHIECGSVELLAGPHQRVVVDDHGAEAGRVRAARRMPERGGGGGLGRDAVHSAFETGCHRVLQRRVFLLLANPLGRRAAGCPGRRHGSGAGGWVAPVPDLSRREH